ncbi:MAG: phosphotransferase [Acidimicrobiaceae bacterium]|nr:phosphotransferase [Acidimicrobiaceae bacterium]
MPLSKVHDKDLLWSLVNQDSDEPVLLVGNVTVGLVRIGDTVRRPAMQWSKSVDALLTHFQDVGFKGAPRALGYDENGRQVLSFEEGFVDPDPSDLDTTRLMQVGRVIRKLHDASSSFSVPAGSVWNVAIAPDAEDLICHHDLAPWNLVRTPTQLTFIDWDGAGPGSRLWDLAYAAHGFVPLSPVATRSDDDASQRLAALIEGYGLDRQDRSRLLDMLSSRIRSMYDLLRSGHERGAQPWARLWDEGHGATWQIDSVYVDDRRKIWAKALGVADTPTA